MKNNNQKKKQVYGSFGWKAFRLDKKIAPDQAEASADMEPAITASWKPYYPNKEVLQPQQKPNLNKMGLTSFGSKLLRMEKAKVLRNRLPRSMKDLKRDAIKW